MSWSTPTGSVAQAPSASAEDANGIRFNITLDDVGYGDQYAAVRTALGNLLDALDTAGWNVYGGANYIQQSIYTPNE